jgi:hypothetical protein
MADEPAAEPQAPEAEPAAPEPGTPDAYGTPAAPEPAAETSPPDVGDALAQLNSRLEGIEGRLPQPAEQPAIEPWEAFTQPAEPEEPVYPEQPQADQQPAEDPLVKEFYDLVDQRVNQIVAPHFQQQEMAGRKQAIDGLVEKYPDFAEAIPVIGKEMQQMADQYGKPELATDPRLAERLYQARKAEAVASAETPAEAVGPGANLETHAGGGGEPDETFQDQYMKPIMETVNQGGDAFT